jgi:two-component system OmpR family response regulator
MRVLLVEDEPKMARLLHRGLIENGHTVELARSGEAAVDAATTGQFDVVVLDVMLPDIDGFDVCRRLRRGRIWVPVLMLTARTALRDRVHGLDVGADDYLTKPFALAELLARLRALARRGPVERPTVLAVGDLTLDPATRQVCRGGENVLVSAREFALLEAFMRRPGRVLTRDQLLALAWEATESGHSNVVDVYVRYLREKIDRPFGHRSLETVRGVGYRLDTSGR